MIKIEQDGYYLNIFLSGELFKSIPDNMIISKTFNHIKYLCANGDEIDFISKLTNINLNKLEYVTDWFRIIDSDSGAYDD
jgi:hypothetical protein